MKTTGSRHPERFLDGTTRISNFNMILDHTKKITVAIFVFFILGAFEVRGEELGKVRES